MRVKSKGLAAQFRVLYCIVISKTKISYTHIIGETMQIGADGSSSKGRDDSTKSILEFLEPGSVRSGTTKLSELCEFGLSLLNKKGNLNSP